jgi:hypothetical protein
VRALVALLQAGIAELRLPHALNAAVLAILAFGSNSRSGTFV